MLLKKEGARMTKRILLIGSSVALGTGIISFAGVGFGNSDSTSGFYVLLLGSVLLATLTCLLCVNHAIRHRRWDWLVIGLVPLLLVELLFLVLLSPLVPSNAALPDSLTTLFTIQLFILPWLGPLVLLIYAALSSGSPAWMVRILGS
jgi:hypothetical protein